MYTKPTSTQFTTHQIQHKKYFKYNILAEKIIFSGMEYESKSGNNSSGIIHYTDHAFYINGRT